jgi:quinoprotein glucose dehydrogenase
MVRLPALVLAAGLLVSVSVALVLAGPPATPSPATPASSDDWPAYAHDLRSTKYSPLALIDKESFAKLRIAWRWRSPDNDIVQKNASLHLNLFEGTPLMIDGVLYVSTGLNQIAAIDAATGRTRWIYDPGIYKVGVPKRLGFVHRGVAMWGPRGKRRVLMATGDGYLIALDADTGRLAEGFGERGRVDLTKGLRRPVERFVYGVNSPPIVIGDVVIVGSFVSDGWLMREGAPGDVRGFDARSGRLLWTFHTVPQAGEPGSETWLEDSWRAAGSTNVWTWMSADEQLGYVFCRSAHPPMTTTVVTVPATTCSRRASFAWRHERAGVSGTFRSLTMASGTTTCRRRPCWRT